MRNLLVIIAMIGLILMAYVTVAVVDAGELERDRLARSCEVRRGYSVLGYYDNKGRLRCQEKAGKYIILM